MASTVEPAMLAYHCPVPNCLAPNSAPAGGRKHAWHYHVTPLPFDLAGSPACFTFKEGKLLCPFPDCSMTTNRRDRATKHVREAHNLPQDVPVFEGTSVVAGEQDGVECSTLSNGPLLPSTIEKETGPEKSTPVLSPLIDYLEGGGVLDRLGVWFHCGLKVFICRPCRVGLTSEVLKGHLKAQHKHAIAGKDWEDLQTFLCRVHVFGRPEDVPLPSPGGPAVQGLGAPEPGFACRMRGCAYAVKSEEVMKKHQCGEHGLVHPLEKRYSPCNLQALFNSVGKVFFQVLDGLARDKDVALRHMALLDVGMSWNVDGTAAIATDKDRTPPALLRVTGWADYLPQVRASRGLRAKALALKDRLKPDELGGILQGLAEAVNGLFRLGQTLLNGRSSKLTALKIIIHGANIPSEG
ncbi:hypothetical protein JVT61DRAFT_9012 [Boletus reticuloceps]|uniref:C2H2-type domain-containing protein n=1 Tax=Boletus reticuloceps TaxID=495285 RepID=A0A8I3A573_9AGAM|nr:hypothetical protein JVT61DRAFT_9012 [Boletus reticuloceps]